MIVILFSLNYCFRCFLYVYKKTMIKSEKAFFSSNKILFESIRNTVFKKSILNVFKL